MQIAGHTKTLRLFLWITAHIYCSFHFSITVFTVAYASCNYAMKEFISSGNLKQRERPKRTGINVQRGKLKLCQISLKYYMLMKTIS